MFAVTVTAPACEVGNVTDSVVLALAVTPSLVTDAVRFATPGAIPVATPVGLTTATDGVSLVIVKPVTPAMIAFRESRAVGAS